MWQYPRKTFCSVYIRAAPLIVKKMWYCDSWLSTIQLCLLRLFHIASVSGACEACFVAAHVNESEGRSSRFWCECCHSLIWAATNMRCSHNSTNTCFTSRLKDIQICIHAAADPERATQTVFSTSHHYICYKHLNNRSRPTVIKVYSLAINTYCLQ